MKELKEKTSKQTPAAPAPTPATVSNTPDLAVGQTQAEGQAEEEIRPEEELKLPFPTAAVVREMKKHIESNKMIRKEVKIAMNKFLAEIVKNVSETMDKNPYAMMDYRMFEDATKPYRQVKELQAEKDRLKAHLDVVIQDCASIKRDLDLKFSKPETE